MWRVLELLNFFYQCLPLEIMVKNTFKDTIEAIDGKTDKQKKSKAFCYHTNGSKADVLLPHKWFKRLDVFGLHGTI